MYVPYIRIIMYVCMYVYVIMYVLSSLGLHYLHNAF